MDDPAGLLLLARDGGQVIGHLAGKVSAPDPVRTAAVAVLESMRVAPDPRTAGVGSLLIWHFFAWARERVTRQASVTAYAGNHAAERFYERHGFAPAREHYLTSPPLVSGTRVNGHLGGEIRRGLGSPGCRH
jgi:GNAT superfamily N-acetyltransferase